VRISAHNDLNRSDASLAAEIQVQTKLSSIADQEQFEGPEATGGGPRTGLLNGGAMLKRLPK
jgi:hypothetical protein